MRTTSELLNAQETSDWIIKRLLPKNGKLMIGGCPKSGKSLLTLATAYSVLHQPIYHGFKVQTNGTVLMIENDMPMSSHARRIRKLTEDGYNFGGMYHITKDLMPPAFNILQDGHYSWLESQVSDLKPTLIIFDVLRSLYLGDENNSDVAAHVMAKIDALLLAGNSSCVIIHHSKKGGFNSESGTMLTPVEAVRGSSVISGSMDTICALNDTGTMCYYQGRDIGNIHYSLTTKSGSLKNRIIRSNTNGRQQQIEKLYAQLLDSGYAGTKMKDALNEYIENISVEEYESARSVVGNNHEVYLW